MVDLLPLVCTKPVALACITPVAPTNKKSTKKKTKLLRAKVFFFIFATFFIGF
jgi:hypothetical protein